MSSPKDVSYFKDPKHGYLGSASVLRAGVQLIFSEAEVSEYIKCLDSPIYFIKNYCQIVNLDRGLVPFELYPYQEKMVGTFHTNKNVITLACRQSGKTQSVAAYLLWYVLFNPSKTVAVLANKGAAAREILSRITDMLENLPFCLQNGCRELNKGSIVFESKSKVFSAATSGSSIRGKSCVTGDTLVETEKRGSIRIDLVKADDRVLTKEGFKSFVKLLDQGVKETLVLKFFDGTYLKCTPDHKLFCDDTNTFIQANILSEGSIVSGKTIIKISKGLKERVYDLQDVKDTHSYYTNGVISHNCNLLYLDEFSFVDNDVQFYTSTYPVITSGKTAKVIITSTPNGTGNMFHKIWEGASQGTNGFTPFKVNWWDVPGRDEAWKNETIANTSELQFSQEFGVEFLGSSNTLISGDSLMGLKASTPIHMEEDKCMSIYAYPHQDHKYIGVVDVSKGRGQDYSVFHMIDITANPMKVVATYRNNNISPLLYPQVLEKYGTLYNNALMVIESNDAGCQVASDLYYDIEYENTYVESRTKAGAIGLTMTSRVKRMGCSNLKDLIEGGKLSVSDKNTIIELSVFAAKGDSYAATKGNHDDCVMPLVLFAYFIGTKDFADETNISLKDILYKNTQTEEVEDEDEPTFVGFMNNDNGGPTRQVIGNDVWS